MTPASQDGGIDIEGRLDYDWFAADYGVQVKRYAADNTISSDRVHRLAGALATNGYDIGTFITTSSYTGPAIDVANQLPIKLVSGSDLAATMLRHEIGVHRVNDEFYFTNTFWQSLERTDEKVPATDVPLGSNFNRIRAVLAAMRHTEGTKEAVQSWVGTEFDLDLSDRHVYINANSAAVLGFARKEPGGDSNDAQRWGLTSEGAEFLNAPPGSLTAKQTLADALREVELIDRLLDELQMAGALSKAEIDELLAAETTGLSQSSVERRSSSVRAWLAGLPEVHEERRNAQKMYRYEQPEVGQSELDGFEDR